MEQIRLKLGRGGKGKGAETSSASVKDTPLGLHVRSAKAKVRNHLQPFGHLFVSDPMIGSSLYLPKVILSLVRFVDGETKDFWANA